MLTNEQINIVQSLKQQGYTETQIADALRTKGWNDGSISEGLLQLSLPSRQHVFYKSKIFLIILGSIGLLVLFGGITFGILGMNNGKPTTVIKPPLQPTFPSSDMSVTPVPLVSSGTNIYEFKMEAANSGAPQTPFIMMIKLNNGQWEAVEIEQAVINDTKQGTYTKNENEIVFNNLIRENSSSKASLTENSLFFAKADSPFADNPNEADRTFNKITGVWQEYINTDAKFSVLYPPGWEIQNNGSEIEFINTNPDVPVPPNFVSKIFYKKSSISPENFDLLLNSKNSSEDIKGVYGGSHELVWLREKFSIDGIQTINYQIVPASGNTRDTSEIILIRQGDIIHEFSLVSKFLEGEDNKGLRDRYNYDKFLDFSQIVSTFQTTM